MATIRKRTWTKPGGTQGSGWQVDFVDRNGTRRRRLFVTKKAADGFMVEARAQAQRGTYVHAPSSVSVKAAAEEWTTFIEGRVGIDLERATANDYGAKMRLHVLGPHGAGDVKLADLTWSTLERMTYRFQHHGMSTAQARKVLTITRMFLSWCVDEGHLAANPAAGRTLRLGNRDRHDIPLPSHADVAKVLAAADRIDPEFGLICRIGAICGLRASEIRGLRWPNVNLARKRLKVVERVDTYGVVGAPKSRSSIRDVPMSDGLVRRLREHWLLKGRPDDGLVFTDASGGPIDHQNMLKRRFAPTLKAAGFRMRFHDFRAYAISAWLQAGVPLKTAQKRAGHADHHVTLAIYAKVFDEDGRGEELAAIDRRLELQQ